MKISLVIPVYNVEKYLAECLDSLLTQTLSDLQILCVDDGSTDRSCEILDEYARKDSRITVLRKKHGGGPGATRNFALSLIEGKYALFADADDVLDPTLCEKAFRQAEETESEIVVFSYDHFPETDVTNPMDTTPLASIVSTSPTDKLDMKIHAGLFTKYLMPWCKIIRSDFLIENDIRFPENAFFDDNGMNWKPMVLARKISFLPEILYHYRIRSGSVVRPVKRSLPDGVRAYEEAKLAMIGCGAYPNIRSYFLAEWLGLLRSYYRRINPSARIETRKRILETLAADEWDFIRNSGEIKPKVRSFFLKLEKSVNSQTASELFLSSLGRFYVQLVKPLLNRLRLSIVSLIAKDVLRGRDSLRKQVAGLVRERSALEAELRESSTAGEKRNVA